HNDPVNRIDPSGYVTLGELSAVGDIRTVIGPALANLWAGVRNYSRGLVDVEGYLDSGRNRYSEGQADEDRYAAFNDAEARVRNGLAPGLQWSMRKDHFWAAARGAPFLLAQNPWTYVPLLDCGPELVTFSGEFNPYGPAAREEGWEETPLEQWANIWIGGTIENALRFGKRGVETAAGMARGVAHLANLNPPQAGELVVNSIAQLAQDFGTFSTDALGYTREGLGAWGQSLLTPEGIFDNIFFVESVMAGGIKAGPTALAPAALHTERQALIATTRLEREAPALPSASGAAAETQTRRTVQC